LLAKQFYFSEDPQKEGEKVTRGSKTNQNTSPRPLFI